MTTKITQANTEFSTVTWQSVIVADGSTTTTAEAGKGYIIDTSSNTHTINLPASPSAGDQVAIIQSGSNAVTVGRNSSNIQSGTNDIEMSTNAAVELVYSSDSSIGWLKVNNDIPDTFIEATGGTETTSGDYKIHTFTSSGCFAVSSAGTQSHTAEYLVVAGGGSGANNRGGGGGAGGFRTNYPSPDTGGFSITAQTYPITIGAGASGAPYPPTNLPGNAGSNSVFSTITSAGGGEGGYENNPTPGVGGSGGSGGGSGYPSKAGGSGNTPPVSPPQGNNGGNTCSSTNSGSGGGGAGAVGGNAGDALGGNGGNGSSNAISGTATTYAGGGGGSSCTTGGTGGTGGGGTGYGGPNGAHPEQDGDANTGGGGGASRNVVSGAGGSGIVIIRYKYQ